MTKKIYRHGLIAGAVLSTLAFASTAQAQLSIRSPQSLGVVLVGNGVTQSTPIVNVAPTSAPLVGIGALSGGAHGGSLLTISLLNTNRLLGIDVGSTGQNAPTSISLTNPSQRPVLAR